MSTSTAGDVISQLKLDGEVFTAAQIENFKNDKELYKRFVKATEEVVNNKFDYVSTFPDIWRLLSALIKDVK